MKGCWSKLRRENPGFNVTTLLGIALNRVSFRTPVIIDGTSRIFCDVTSVAASKHGGRRSDGWETSGEMLCCVFKAFYEDGTGLYIIIIFKNFSSMQTKNTYNKNTTLKLQINSEKMPIHSARRKCSVMPFSDSG